MANRFITKTVLAEEALFADSFYVEFVCNAVGDLIPSITAEVWDDEIPGMLSTPNLRNWDNTVVLYAPDAVSGEDYAVQNDLLIQDEHLSYEGLRFRGGLGFGHASQQITCDREILTLKLGPCTLTVSREGDEDTSTVALAVLGTEDTLTFSTVLTTLASDTLQVDLAYVNDRVELSVLSGINQYSGIIDGLDNPPTLVRHPSEVRLRYDAINVTTSGILDSLVLVGPVIIDCIASR